MINQFQPLTEDERALLLKAPVLVSVLASCSYNEVNEACKKDAVKLAHLKTFTADPSLLHYYQEVEKHFVEQFHETVEQYYPFDDNKRAQLIREINKVDKVLAKLNYAYAQKLQKSLQKYATHVKRSTHSVFQDFIFPLPIKGLSD